MNVTTTSSVGLASSNRPSTTPKPQDANDPLTQKDTFLQLLVAQIRNQDPLKPTDGVEFLSQLAQFSSLEQSIQLKDEVASVRKAVETLTETVKTNKSNPGVPQP
jgi:flagellar basal-body rod modification protein FlgD